MKVYFFALLIFSSFSMASDHPEQLSQLKSKAVSLYSTGRSTNYIAYAETTIDLLPELLKEQDPAARYLYLINLKIYDFHAVLHYRNFFEGCLFPREGSGSRDHLSRSRQIALTRQFIKYLSRSLELKKTYVIYNTNFLSEKVISHCALAFEDDEGRVLIMQGTTSH